MTSANPLGIVQAARAARADPAVCYATGVIQLPGSKVPPNLVHWWDACIEHYRECAGDPWPPVAPVELHAVVRAMNEAVRHPTVASIQTARVLKTIPPEHRGVLGAALTVIDDPLLANSAVTRIATYIVVNKARGLTTRTGYAVATTRLTSGPTFDKASFKKQLAQYDWYERGLPF